MPKKIWIDLDNSPHVPLFVPIIQELQERGYSVLVTARDAFQVCELAHAAELKYKRIGRHFGRHKLLKVLGLAVRTAQLIPVVRLERPDLAVSHGSRAQLLASFLARIPSVLMMDYEHARGLLFERPTWVMVPESIPASSIPVGRERVLQYPGIKEDVYVPRFTPDSAIKRTLGINDTDLLVTIRPPANEAHYHNPESEGMFTAVVEMLSGQANITMVVLPRNANQRTAIRKEWSRLLEQRKIIIPEHAVDGLNLIWHSDLVISGGGTMNREAAALGVPVYSIFRGKIGAVDRYLAASGRLILLKTIEDIRNKIVLQPRRTELMPGRAGTRTLETIVERITAIVQSVGHEKNCESQPESQPLLRS